MNNNVTDQNEDSYNQSMSEKVEFNMMIEELQLPEVREQANAMSCD